MRADGEGVGVASGSSSAPESSGMLRDVARERANHDISGDRRRRGSWVWDSGWRGLVGFNRPLFLGCVLSVLELKWTGLGEETRTARLLSCQWARPSWRSWFPLFSCSSSVQAPANHQSTITLPYYLVAVRLKLVNFEKLEHLRELFFSLSKLLFGKPFTSKSFFIFFFIFQQFC